MDTPHIESLKSALNFYTSWAGYCTFTVFVGLIFEYAILFFSERKRLTPKEVVLTVIAAIMIAGGVGGEYCFGSKASNVAATLEGVSEQRIADSNREAKQAEDDAEKVKAENLQLEAQIAPRRVTAEQQEKILGNLEAFKAEFSGKRIKVVSYILDTEALVFSEQITHILRSSGMTVDDDAMSITPVATLVFGIQVFGSDSELAKKIADAIGSSGSPIAVSFVNSDPTAGAMRFEYGAPPPSATVLVGIKPPDKRTIAELLKMMPRKPTQNNAEPK